MFLAILALLSAISLSSTAAYFSVFGLMALFSASAGAVAIMGVALEAAKLVAAAWLHRNFRNNKVSKFIKVYMFSGILVLMFITSIGIFGFLSAGHLESTAPTEGMQIKIDSYNQQIQSDQQTIDRANTQLKQLDDSIGVFLKNDRATQGLAARDSQKAERNRLSNTISNAQKDIDRINGEIAALKQQMSDTDQKIGPIKYVAQLFWADNYQAHIDSAVRMMILVIMSVFDPMAVILIIASGISFSDYWESRKKKLSVKEEAIEESFNKPKADPRKETTPQSPSKAKEETKPDHNAPNLMLGRTMASPQPTKAPEPPVPPPPRLIREGVEVITPSKVSPPEAEKKVEKTTTSFYNKFRHMDFGFRKPKPKSDNKN